MKILFFLRRIGPYHHARFLAASKLVDLIAVETRPGSQEYPWVFSSDGGYSIESFPVVDAEAGLRDDTLNTAINTIVEKYKPDVVFTTGWADPEYHAIINNCAPRGIRLIVISDSRREDEPRSFLKESLKKLILRSYSSALVAGSSSRSYLASLGFDPRSIFQPWDVVDNEYFRSFATPPVNWSDRRFLVVSRFIDKKNLMRLIDAYALYKTGGGSRKLTILGSGTLEEDLKRKVSELHLEDSLSFDGFVQYDKLPFYLKSAYALILPSLSDQWGLVVNEAMASGLPVLVSSACGCAVDLVQDNVNGYTFDPLNANNISDALTRSDGLNEDEWIKMGESSQQIIDRWSTSSFAQGILDAAKHSMTSKPRKGFSFLHKLLSKR